MQRDELIVHLEGLVSLELIRKKRFVHVQSKSVLFPVIATMHAGLIISASNVVRSSDSIYFLPVYFKKKLSMADYFSNCESTLRTKFNGLLAARGQVFQYFMKTRLGLQKKPYLHLSQRSVRAKYEKMYFDFINSVG